LRNGLSTAWLFLENSNVSSAFPAVSLAEKALGKLPLKRIACLEGF